MGHLLYIFMTNNGVKIMIFMTMLDGRLNVLWQKVSAWRTVTMYDNTNNKMFTHNTTLLCFHSTTSIHGVPFPFPSKEIENFQDLRVILLLDHLKFSNTASIALVFQILVYFYACIQTQEIKFQNSFTFVLVFHVT